MSSEITVRDAVPADAEALSVIMNEIILIGGTTAHEQTFTADLFNQTYISGEKVFTCVTAENTIVDRISKRFLLKWY